MQTNWKIIAPIAIVGLVAIAIVMSMRDTETVVPTVPALEEQSVVVTPPVDTAVTPPASSVSGDIDDMVGVLTSEATGDAALVADVADGAAAVKNDTQEVNSLTTMYDETTF